MKTPRGLNVAPAVALLAALTVTAFAIIRNLEQRNIESSFQDDTKSSVFVLKGTIQSSLDTILNLGSFFAASETVSRTGFREFVSASISRNPAVQAIEWIPRVRESERAAFEQQARRDGISDFQIRERSLDGTMARAGSRPEYFPVFYVEPIKGNEAALGYDLGSNSTRLLALSLARDTGDAAATAPIRLVQERGDQKGILLLWPVYAPHSKVDTLAARRENLAGFVLVVFRIGDLVQGALASLGSRGFDVYVFDTSSEPGELLFFHSPSRDRVPMREAVGSNGVSNLRSGLHSAAEFGLGGRKWLVLCKPWADYIASQRNWESWAVLGGGFLLTMLLAFHLLSRSRTTDALRESEERYRNLVDISPDGIVLMELDTAIRLCNPQAARLLGYSDERELRGRSLLDVVTPGDRDLMKKNVTATLEDGTSAEVEYTLISRQGEQIPVAARKSVLTDAKGDPAAVIFICRDIRMRKRAEEERVRLEIQLRQAQKLEAVGQLAAGIAHEINTPTQYIGDNARFLKASFESLKSALEGYRRLLIDCRSGEVSPALLSDVERTIDSADIDYLIEEIPKAISQSLDGIAHVSTIVRAMKEFSHPGGDHKQATDLNHAIGNTVMVCRNEWKLVADMELDLDPRLPQVYCLPGDFNQVIMNLVINAAHAVAEASEAKGGGKGRITIQTRREGSWIEIRVGDTGLGIPESVQGRIFEPFFTTKPVGRGTGQGLAISRSIVVGKHGGTIDFVTGDGTGTTFTIRLPLIEQEAADEEEACPAP